MYLPCCNSDIYVMFTRIPDDPTNTLLLCTNTALPCSLFNIGFLHVAIDRAFLGEN